MAKYALIHKGETRINQVIDSEAEKFEVHENLEWIECPDNVTIDFEYIDGHFYETVKPKTNYLVARKVGYGDIGAQLGDIYDALAAGGDATAALAQWQENQRLIKILFPKDNDEAMDAAHEEVLRRQNLYYDYLVENGLEFDKQPNKFALEVATDYVEGRWICPVRGQYVAPTV